MSKSIPSGVEPETATNTKWQEQAIVHLERASEGATKGHAGTWDREMQLARLCMEHEQKLATIKTP